MSKGRRDIMLKSVLNSSLPILLLATLVSCAHKKPIQEMTTNEIASVMMEESQLNTALRSSVSTSNGCMRGLLQGLPPQHAEKIVSTMKQTMSYEELHRVVLAGLTSQLSREEISGLALKLEEKSWQKFKKGLSDASKAGNEINELMFKLQKGELDLKSPRVAHIAKITERSFSLNLMKVGNDSVRSFMQGELKRLPANRKSLVDMINVQLGLQEENAKKVLFIVNYYATQNLSDSELVEVAEIRGLSSYIKGRELLEKEMSVRMYEFIKTLSAQAKS